jgi:hypothetical protein
MKLVIKYTEILLRKTIIQSSTNFREGIGIIQCKFLLLRGEDSCW